MGIWPKTCGPFHGSVWLENKLLGSNPLEQVDWFESELTTDLDNWAEGGQLGLKSVTRLETGFAPGWNA
jgi:hypothetical protein